MTPRFIPISSARRGLIGSGEHPVTLRWRGLEPYGQSFDAMRAFTDARTPDTPDEIWLVEHPQVFTLGLAGDPAHLLIADSDIPLVKVDRGGQITYHGPGQVVAYLLLDLRRRKLMVRELVRRIEEAVIETLAAYNLATDRKAGAPGIYVAPPFETPSQAGRHLHEGAKIAALGLKIRNRLQLSRREPEREDGSAAVSRDQSMWLRGTRNSRHGDARRRGRLA